MGEGETSNPFEGVGARLTRARERLGLTRLKAAERLHLEQRLVEALETEHFELLGPTVYARGHLRRYAELVGEDATALERLYTAQRGVAVAPDLSRVVSQPPPPPPASFTIGTRAAAIVAGALALIGLVWWAWTPSTPDSGSQPQGSQMELRVSFIGDGWTEIYDASGQQLYYDTGRAGSVVTLQGRTPLRVVLGNAPAVALDLDGRRVQLPADAVADETIQLSVDANGQASRAGEAQGAR